MNQAVGLSGAPLRHLFARPTICICSSGPPQYLHRSVTSGPTSASVRTSPRTHSPRSAEEGTRHGCGAELAANTAHTKSHATCKSRMRRYLFVTPHEPPTSAFLRRHPKHPRLLLQACCDTSKEIGREVIDGVDLIESGLNSIRSAHQKLFESWVDRVH